MPSSWGPAHVPHVPAARCWDPRPTLAGVVWRGPRKGSSLGTGQARALAFSGLGGQRKEVGAWNQRHLTDHANTLDPFCHFQNGEDAAPFWREES